MRSRNLSVAILVLLGLGVATLEEAFVHFDDGCVVETHCPACLLRLGTPGILSPTFSLPPRVLAAVGPVTEAPPTAHEAPAPRGVASRGPPPA